jgi:hypothetical protein
VDIDLTFPDGACHTLKCKRVDQFGPTKANQVAADHTGQAVRRNCHDLETRVVRLKNPIADALPPALLPATERDPERTR